MSVLTSTQIARLNNLSPSLLESGFELGTVFDQALQDIQSGNLGIDADANDVDALAEDGGHFAQGTHAGLLFAFGAGRFLYNDAVVSVVAGTVALSGSTTNYIEVNAAGTVSKNTAGFTAGSLPLYTAVTDSSNITSVENKKPLMTLGGAGGGKRTIQVNAGDKSATFTLKFIAPVTGKVSGSPVGVDTTVSTNDTNYWSASALNKSNANAVMFAATDANTTKATGGSAITADTTRNMTLTGTTADLNCTKGDLIEVTWTKTASAADLINFVQQLEFTPTT